MYAWSASHTFVPSLYSGPPQFTLIGVMLGVIVNVGDIVDVLVIVDDKYGVFVLVAVEVRYKVLVRVGVTVKVLVDVGGVPVLVTVAVHTTLGSRISIAEIFGLSVMFVVVTFKTPSVKTTSKV
jgi:hypothetical protein